MLHGTLSILLAVCLGVLCPLNCEGAFDVFEEAPAAACCSGCAHHAPASPSPAEEPGPGQSSDAPAGNCICRGAVSAERVDVQIPFDLASLVLPAPVVDEAQPALWEALGFTPARRNTGPVPLYCLLGVYLR